MFNIDKIHRYINTQSQFISKYLPSDKNYEYIFNKNNIIIKSGNIKLECEYVSIGVYNTYTSVFYTGDININLKNNSKQNIFNGISNELKKNKIKVSHEESDLLNFIENNNIFIISHNNINNLLNILAYINKYLWMFPIAQEQTPYSNNETDTIEYVAITKILRYNEK